MFENFPKPSDGLTIISKDGFFYCKWNSEERTWSYKRLKKERTVAALRNYCFIVEDTTLGDLFRAVQSAPFLRDFITIYSRCPVEEFHAQAAEPMRSENYTPLDYLEIFWSKSLHENHIDFFPEFHGLGPAGREQDEDNPEKIIAWSISYSPMYDMADVPLKLNKKITIEGKEFEKNFTFLEVLDAVYDDISFVGGPADNAEFLEGLKEQVDRIKSGEEKLISMNDLMGDFQSEEVLFEEDKIDLWDEEDE